MNIFFLHPDPLTSAEMHCDKHCVKMILETAQMLCTAHRALDGDGDVTVEEVKTISEIRKTNSQKRMAWTAIAAMIIFTALLFLPIFPDGRIKALSDLFGLFYIGMAGVVGAYMGVSAWMSKR